MYTKLLVVLSVRTFPLIEHSSTIKHSEVTDTPMRELGRGHVSPYHSPQSDTANGKLNRLNWPMLIAD